MTVLIPRTAWTPDFPDVFVHNALRARNTHPAYVRAKSGDALPAKTLVEDLLSTAETKRLARFLNGRRVILLAVTADEMDGFNAIPDAMAQAAESARGRGFSPFGRPMMSPVDDENA